MLKYLCVTHIIHPQLETCCSLNKYSVRLSYSFSPPDAAVKQFFLQACGGDTQGPGGQGGRESTERERRRQRLEGSCL